MRGRRERGERKSIDDSKSRYIASYVTAFAATFRRQLPTIPTSHGNDLIAYNTCFQNHRRVKVDIDQDLIIALQHKYESKTSGKADWEQEEAGICRALKELIANIHPRYKIISPINIGGTAIVFQLVDTHLNVPRALKLARPLAGKEIFLKNILDSEIERLAECSHPNIVSIYDKGQTEANGTILPYYVMEFLEGALDALDWVEKGKPPVVDLIRFLQQCVEGLTFLHRQKTIHGDVKLENVLVLPNGHAKLSDLGSARRLDAEEPEETLITFTRPYAHPILRGLLSGTSETDPNRVRAPLKRTELDPIFDIYALGKNIFRLLSYYDVTEHELLPQYERRYLDLMACRMLDGYVSGESNSLGLPDNALSEIKYKSIDEIGLDLKKLTGEYNLCQVINELNHHFPRSIQCSHLQSASLSERVANILSSPYIRRLGGISQLGLIVQIYPTATHSRLEHTLGCYSNICRYIDALWHDPVNPLFKQVFTEHDVNVTLLAALCHDIGQYPMAHDLEEADSELFSHKTIGSDILKNKSDKDSVELRKLMQSEWGVEPEEVVALLETTSTDLSLPLKKRFLHSLIDGPLDADKLDYLVRDSINLNVPYGQCIDFERLLRCLTVAFKQQGVDTFITLGIHEKGKIPAEAVAFARYSMFGSVYWHHTSRSAKAMLHRALWEAIPNWDKRSKEYKRVKESFFIEIGHQGRIGQNKGIQASLFDQNEIIAETPQLAVSDYDMLCWVYQLTKPRAKALIEMLCRRVLFKRLLVLSHRKNSSLWERLTNLRKMASGEQMIFFQNNFQKGVVRLIDSLSDEKRASTVMQKSFTDDIVNRDAQGEILFLIDIPGDRPGSVTELTFLPEHRIYGPLTGFDQHAELEDSVIWNSLTKQFAFSVGKVRIFCVPDIIATCTACLTRKDLEGVMEAAAK